MYLTNTFYIKMKPAYHVSCNLIYLHANFVSATIAARAIKIFPSPQHSAHLRSQIPFSHARVVNFRLFASCNRCLIELRLNCQILSLRRSRDSVEINSHIYTERVIKTSRVIKKKEAHREVPWNPAALEEKCPTSGMAAVCADDVGERERLICGLCNESEEF
jgi:hypothetical protein